MRSGGLEKRRVVREEAGDEEQPRFMGTFCFKVQKEALCLTTFLNFQKRVLSAHALQKERKCAQSERASAYVYDGADENALSLTLSLSRKYSIRYYKYVCISLATCFVPSLCALAEDICARIFFV